MTPYYQYGTIKRYIFIEKKSAGHAADIQKSHFCSHHQDLETSYMDKIIAWFASTHIHEQLLNVDAHGLFTNPWFIVPFGIFLAWMLYKNNWKEILIIAIIIAAWWFSGTEYMDGLVVDGVIQLEKVLPVVFAAAAGLGVIIYLLFGRSD